MCICVIPLNRITSVLKTMVIYIRSLLVLIFGYVLGILLAFLVFTTIHPEKVFTWYAKDEIKFTGRNLSTNSVGDDDFELFFNGYHHNNLSYYTDLKNKVILLCVLFVKDVDNAYVSSNTWMTKCNYQLYFGLKSDNYLNIVVLNPSNSWHYLCNIFRHIFNNFNNPYHWILFSKENNFVIPENLRQLVVNLNYSDTYYLGHKALFWNVYFNSGRSSYVVSKGTVDMLMTKFTSNEDCIKGGQHWNMEDYYLGKHLAQLGIYPRDTRDAQLRGRFHVTPVSFMLNPVELGVIPDYDSRSVYKQIKGEGCCSPYSVSFPVSSVSSMYFYSYLIYVVRLCKDVGMLSAAYSNDQAWKDFILEMNPSANLSSITAQKYYDIWSNILDPPMVFNQKLRQLFLRDKGKS